LSRRKLEEPAQRNFLRLLGWAALPKANNGPVDAHARSW